MVRSVFLCHEPWYKNQANPIIRSLPYLFQNGHVIDVIIVNGHAGSDLQVWPDVAELLEHTRRKNLDSAVKVAISSLPDFILCHHRCITSELLKSNVPLIILEHTDAPALELARYLIQLDNVIGVIKGTIFSNNSSYNGPFCEGMFHGTDLNKQLELPLFYPKYKLTEKEFSKIELGYSFGCFPSNKRLLEKQIDNKRIIPISFIGQTNYSRSRLITKHRQNAMQVTKKIGGVSLSGISVEEFDAILLSSYVCLSPLGYGSCYRSFEGLYAGCIVVQPDCSYMKSWPNIYTPGEAFVACDIDFVDVLDITNSIIENWDKLQEKRHNNKKKLLDTYWNEQSLGEHLKGIFNRCCKKIK